MNKYFYLTKNKNIPIYVTAKRKPSIYTMPKSGTWVVREWYDGGWHMPCFPEITWGMLKNFQYIGKINEIS